MACLYLCALMKCRVLIIAALVPIFIAALALGAFMNGFCPPDFLLLWHNSD